MSDAAWVHLYPLESVSFRVTIRNEGPVKKYARFEWEPGQYKTSSDYLRVAEGPQYFLKGEDIPDGWELDTLKKREERRNPSVESN